MVRRLRLTRNKYHFVSYANKNLSLEQYKHDLKYYWFPLAQILLKIPDQMLFRAEYYF